MSGGSSEALKVQVRWRESLTVSLGATVGHVEEVATVPEPLEETERGGNSDIIEVCGVGNECVALVQAL